MKIDDRVIFACRIVAGETPAFDLDITYSRTCIGRIIDIFIGPNIGIRCLSML